MSKEVYHKPDVRVLAPVSDDWLHYKCDPGIGGLEVWIDGERWPVNAVSAYKDDDGEWVSIAMSDADEFWAGGTQRAEPLFSFQDRSKEHTLGTIHLADTSPGLPTSYPTTPGPVYIDDMPWMAKHFAMGFDRKQSLVLLEFLAGAVEWEVYDAGQLLGPLYTTDRSQTG